MAEVKARVSDGIAWGKYFTLRIPGIHHPITWPEMLQGPLVCTAIAGSVAPLMMKYFNLSFEVAWAVAFIQMFWVWTQIGIFGDPYHAGWITPLLPLTLAYLGTLTPGIQAVHAILALMIVFIAITTFFGLTGLGAKFVDMVPNALKGGIVFGAGIAAFIGEYKRFGTMPYSLTVAWIIIFIIVFSVPFMKLKKNYKVLGGITAMGLLISLLGGGLVGFLTGEVTFNIKWGFYVPDFIGLWQNTSPFVVGLPSLDTFVRVLPLAIAAYLIFFGDYLTGSAIVNEANSHRDDAYVDANPTRSHLVAALKNLGHLLTGGPFIPLHGIAWMGGTVYLYERYKDDKEKVPSIYGAISNFKFLALILVFFAPVVTFMQPLFPIALSSTLLLQGFICSYIAMSFVNTNLERGLCGLIGVTVAVHGVTIGLLVGIAATLLLQGVTTKRQRLNTENTVISEKC